MIIGLFTKITDLTFKTQEGRDEDFNGSVLV